MFRKAHDVGVSSASALRNKEARALREAAARAFPAATDADLDALLGGGGKGGGLEAAKLASKAVAYAGAGDHVPVLVDLDPRAPLRRLLPTVYGLWRVPHLLPTLVVPAQVSGFLLGGADLMLPGVLVPRGGGLPPFAAGALLAVRVAGNPAPFAVGEAAVSAADAAAGGMRGRGLRVLHAYRDELWAHGGRGVPNAGFGTAVVRPLPAAVGGGGAGVDADMEGGAYDDDDGSDSDDSDGSNGGGGGGGGGGDNSDGGGAGAAADGDAAAAAAVADGVAGLAVSAAAPTPPPPAPPPAPAYPWERWDADTLLTATLCQVLRRHLPHAPGGGLPVLANVLYGTHMTAARPAGTSLDPRRSSWRKVGAFLKAMGQDGAKLLTVVDDAAKGTLTVTGWDRGHDLLRAHRPWPPALEAAAAEGGAGGGGGAGGDDDGGGAPVDPADADLSLPATTAVMAPGAPAQPYAPPVITEYVRPSHAQARIFKWVAAEAVRARRMPAGTLPPRGARRRRARHPGEDVASGGGGSGDTGGGAFDAHTALRLAGDPGGALYTRSQAGAVLAAYIASRGLALPNNKRKVALDAWLADALTGRLTHRDDEGAGGGAPLSASDAAAFPPLAPSASAAAAAADVANDDRDGDDADTAASSDDDDDAAAADDAAEAALAALLAARMPAPPPPPVVSAADRGGDGASVLLREDVSAGWAERLLQVHTITFPSPGASGSGASAAAAAAAADDGETLLRRGPPPPITLHVRRLQGGRKHTTHVQGYQYYRLPQEQLAREAARLYAASASAQPAPNNPAITEIYVQGDVAEALAGHIAVRYGIPRRLLAVADDAGGGGGGGKKGRSS